MICKCGHGIGQHIIAGGCTVGDCLCLRFELIRHRAPRRGKGAPPAYREATPREKYALSLLVKCRLQSYSWERKFLRGGPMRKGITENQSRQIWRLAVKYRRQIDDPFLIREAEEILNGRVVNDGSGKRSR